MWTNLKPINISYSYYNRIIPNGYYRINGIMEINAKVRRFWKPIKDANYENQFKIN